MTGLAVISQGLASLGFKVAGERSHANYIDASFPPIQRVARASEEDSDDGNLAQTRTAGKISVRWPQRLVLGRHASSGTRCEDTRTDGGEKWPDAQNRDVKVCRKL